MRNEASDERISLKCSRLDRDSPSTRVLKNNRSGCVFLRGNLCAVYPARPKAWRDFPQLSFGTHSLGSRISSLVRAGYRTVRSSTTPSRATIAPLDIARRTVPLDRALLAPLTQCVPSANADMNLDVPTNQR